MKIVNKYLTLSISILLLLSCSQYSESSSDTNNSEIVAIIGKKSIRKKELDSIAAVQIYNLQLTILKYMVRKEIIVSEAKKLDIPLKDLKKMMIDDKSKNVTIEDFKEYISQSNITHIDTNNILTYIESIHKRERETEYVDSLMIYYPFKIKLRPPFSKTIKTDKIYSYNLNLVESDINVYIISDFKCHSCQESTKKLQKLYKKYDHKVNFKFVYVSDYFDNSALACEAAAKQGEFKKMHDIIFSNTSILQKDSVFYNFADSIGLDLVKFDKDFNNDKNLFQLLRNKKYLASNNIYSTPTFIVNGKIFDSRYAIDYLEDVISLEIKNKH